MTINKELLGPQNQEEEEAFAIETLVFSVQVSLQKAMSRQGVTSKDLAERLGMTPARVSQIFSSKGPNLTLKTIAKIVHALGEDFEFVRKQDMPRSRASGHVEKFIPVMSSSYPSVWKERVANNSNYKMRLAA